jgi:hypothetical protein
LLPFAAWIVFRKMSRFLLLSANQRMGFWDFLFGKQLRLEDEEFGSLLYFDCKNPESNYFEATRLFTPTGTGIELLITGKPPGPSTTQRAFYRQIEAQYFSLLPAIAELITAEIRNWQPDFELRDFAREFYPVHILLPASVPDSNKIEWEIAFEAMHDKNHTFTVTLQGFLPSRVHVDG